MTIIANDQIRIDGDDDTLKDITESYNSIDISKSYSNITINSASTLPYTYHNTGNNMWSGSPTIYTPNTTSPWITTNGSSGLHVTSDAEFEGDIKWKGRSLVKLLEKIENRLAILQEPDPEKLEKFAALKKAYDNYKLLEKLIGDDTNDNS
jgi:hypothetical protein